ncbi:MAG TPA: hypothetical protein VNB06_22695 [Thermoanaerobaculia bacterium]|nr:hypothetical protein [Thermoanaerobaculia bacterium]
MLDAVAATLLEVAAPEPLLLVLEDLHAGDPSSLLQLEMVASRVRQAPVVLVGTYRAVEAERANVGGLIRRVARHAQSVRLEQLSRDDVADYLRGTLEPELLDQAVESIYNATDGNPLYLVEVLRLLSAQTPEAAPRGGSLPPVPSSLRAVIRELVTAHSPGARDILGAASVLGRDVEVPLLARTLRRDETEIEHALVEVVDGGALDPVSPGRYRFHHILVREVIHGDLPDDRRSSLHAQVAEILRERAPGESEAPWFTLAHHYAEAGPRYRDLALEAAVRAGHRALSQLAFDEAAASFGRALQALDADADPRRRCRLLLALARARLRAGDVVSGRTACLEAADLARRLDDSQLLALAGLEYGSVFVFADVDRQLVELLEEADAALGAADSPLRARVLARLASAKQPSSDPQEPIRLARAAIDMARRGGDDRSLLETLRAGVAAMMDLADPSERLPLNLEHVRLAEQLGEPTEAWRGYLRLALDRSELGDLESAGEALQQADRHAAELGHPYYRWPIIALRAMHASATGDFGRAEQLHRAARELADRADDPNTSRALLLQQVALLRAQERYDELLPLRAEILQTLRGSRYLEDLALTLQHSLPAYAGATEEQATALPVETFERLIGLGDAAPLEEVADIAFAHQLRDLAEKVLAAKTGERGRWASQGMTGLALLSSAERSGALAAATLERWDEAVSWYRDALVSARRWNARPASARLSFELARTLYRRGAPGDRDHAANMLDLAERLATALPLPGLLPRIAELRRQANG